MRDKKEARDTINVPHSRCAKEYSLRSRVLAFLEANAPTEFQPKFISAKIQRSHEAVKKCIQREMKDAKSQIVRTREGWYRYAHSIETFQGISGSKRLGIHGIQIQGKCPDKNTRYYLHKIAPFKLKGMGEHSMEFNGRPVTIRVFQNSPTVIAWLKATKNPLDFEEFDKFVYWLYGWASGKVPETTWQVKEWGWNVDFVDMDMTKSGFKALTLHVFRNAWFRMYQKNEDRLRVETHLTPKDVSLQDCQRIIAQMIGIANGESAYQAPSEDTGDFAYQ